MSAADLRKAYLRRARSLHPDQSGDTAGMQELNAAWEVLGDASTRVEYDRALLPPPPPPARRTPEPSPWDDEDARVEAGIRQRMNEPFDPVAAFLRALPVLALLFVLFVVFVFTAFARGGPSEDGEVPGTNPAVTVASD